MTPPSPRQSTIAMGLGTIHPRINRSDGSKCAPTLSRYYFSHGNSPGDKSERRKWTKARVCIYMYVRRWKTEMKLRTIQRVREKESLFDFPHRAKPALGYPNAFTTRESRDAKIEIRYSRIAISAESCEFTRVNFLSVINTQFATCR